MMLLSSKLEIILLMMYYPKFLPHFLLFDFPYPKRPGLDQMVDVLKKLLPHCCYCNSSCLEGTITDSLQSVKINCIRADECETGLLDISNQQNEPAMLFCSRLHNDSAKQKKSKTCRVFFLHVCLTLKLLYSIN